MHENYKKWLDDGCPKIFCKCGCEGEIIINEGHKYEGIPKYFRGHNKNKNITHESYSEWIKQGQLKVFCRCGCNKEIIIKKWHKWYGIPEYIGGHQFFEKHSSKETRQKLRDAKLGKNNPCYGKYGENHPRYGIHLSEETKNNLSEIGKKRLGEKASNWQGGKSFEPYCSKFNSEKREEVRNEYNRKCYLCGKSEEDQIKEQKEKGKRLFRLSVHHIDEDKEQGCNGKSWKLVPVCLKCHRKIHSHKIKL